MGMTRVFFLTVGLAMVLLVMPDVVDFFDRWDGDTYSRACAVGLILWGLVVLGVHKYKRERSR